MKNIMIRMIEFQNLKDQSKLLRNLYRKQKIRTYKYSMMSRCKDLVLILLMINQ